MQGKNATKKYTPGLHNAPELRGLGGLPQGRSGLDIRTINRGTQK